MIIDFTEDSEYKRLFNTKEKERLNESESNEEPLERKGDSAPSTETSRQNTEGNKC